MLSELHIASFVMAGLIAGSILDEKNNNHIFTATF